MATIVLLAGVYVEHLSWNGGTYIIQLQHIKDLHLDLVATMRSNKLIQILPSPSSNHSRDPILNKSLRNSLADARSGADDENFLVGEGHFCCCSLELELIIE